MENFRENRREFIKKMTALGVFSQLPLWYSCQDGKEPLPFKVLTRKQQNLLADVMGILFPDSDTINIELANTVYYLDFILSDTNYDPDEKDYLLEGIGKTEAFSLKIANQSFVDLSAEKQQKLIDHIAQKNWGSYWLSRLLTVIFESLLLDPIYNINTDGSGWQWLQHLPGVPRPSEANSYANLLKRKQVSQVITEVSSL